MSSIEAVRINAIKTFIDKKISSVKSDIEELRQSFSIKDDFTKQIKEIQQVTTDFYKLKPQYNALQEIIKQQDNTFKQHIEEVKQQVLSLETEIDAFEHGHGNEHQINEELTRINTQIKELQQVSSDFDELKQQVDTIREKIEQQENTFKKHIDEVKQLFISLETEIDAFQNGHDNGNGHKMNEELTRIIDAKDTKFKQFKKEIDVNRNEIQEIKKKMTDEHQIELFSKFTDEFINKLIEDKDACKKIASFIKQCD